jgi:hypothetical protein
MSEEPESINVQRRRKGSGDGPSGRAEAPHRGDSGQGGGYDSGGGSSGGGGGGLSLPGGKLGGCGTVIVIILFVIYYLVTGGGGSSTDSQTTDQGGQDTTSASQSDSPAAVYPTNTPRPTRAPSNSTKSGETWLVLLYQDADDDVLEQDIDLDLNEAERVGSSDRVTIVSQIDRYKGAFKGDGNWTSARRYLVQRDNDLGAIHSDMLTDLGEVSMAQGQTLVDFATWGIKTYPADHYVLVLSDHGMGWPGGWTDPAPLSADPGSAPLVKAIDGDMLYLSEIDAALGKVRQQTGIDKFDIVGLDACLMSQLEVYAALQPHARYAVASEETEPSLGWAYASFLQDLSDNPDMSAEQLSSDIVQSYVAKDQLIVDDQARNQFMGGGSAARLANQIGRDVTLTAVDLGALPDLMQSYNDFAYALQSEDQSSIASARNYAQSYTSIFGKEVPASFIDLGNFAQLAARQTGSDALSQSVKKLMDSMNAAIVAEKHGPAKPGSTGIAIYFPNSSLYRSPDAGPQSYTKIADRFARQSLWDDFLAFHYNDRSFKPDDAAPVAPGSDLPSRAPGAGGISVSAITASSDSASPDKPVKLSAEISGAKIGYIYLLIGLYDEPSKSIFLADTDFLESAKTQNLGGVYYPQWPQKNFIINYEWNVSLFEISDGSTTSLALFTPESYGASAADAAYTVEGTYTFADGGEQKYAQLFFQDGKLVKVMGYNGSQQTGAPAEITPTAGDTFTILRKWLELDSQGAVSKTVSEAGDTLTFGDTPFTWKEVFAPAGNYVVGFIAADNDGNQKASYVNIAVK